MNHHEIKANMNVAGNDNANIYIGLIFGMK
jgi:hypothetical protein